MDSSSSSSSTTTITITIMMMPTTTSIKIAVEITGEWRKIALQLAGNVRQMRSSVERETGEISAFRADNRYF